MKKPSPEFISKDPFLNQCVSSLMTAADDSQLGIFAEDNPECSDEVREAALEFARHLGACRVLGIDVPRDVDGVIPSSMAIAAAIALKATIGRLIELTKELPQLTESAVDVHEILDVCSDLVDSRFYCSFVCDVLNESWTIAVDRNDSRGDDLLMHNGTIREFLDELDQTLNDHASWFEPLANSYFFHNWRVVWQECTDLPPPPWICGTLETSIQQASTAQQQPRLSHQLFTVTQTVLAAAAQQTPSYDRFRWDAPDGEAYATLTVPTVLSEESREKPFVIQFRKMPDADCQVSLAGLPARSLNEQHRLNVSPQELADAQAPMTLVVDNVAWLPHDAG